MDHMNTGELIAPYSVSEQRNVRTKRFDCQRVDVKLADWQSEFANVRANIDKLIGRDERLDAVPERG
jgi:hypothetical protein